jgi:hypothetical protein
MQARSGRGVVLLILAALFVVVAIVIAGFVLFEPASAPCATGEAADNEFVNGAYVPRQETFDNVEDAEAFICHDVPELHADGWELETISAERSHALAQTVDGNGTAIVTLAYRNETLARILVLAASPFITEGSYPEPHTEEDVAFGDYRGKLIRGGINPNVALVAWTDENLWLVAAVTTDAAFDEDALLEVLSTAR